MRIPAVLAAGLASLVVIAPAHAAPRTGTTSEGVRIALDGGTVSLRLPAQTPRGARLRVGCGHGRRHAGGLVSASVSGVRPGQRVRVVLPADEVAEAEFCAFETARRGTRRRPPYGAAVLTPRLEPPVAPVMPGPGVREAVSARRGAFGRVRFALAGARLTVRLGRPAPHSTLVDLICGRLADAPRGVSARKVAVRRGARTLTADFGDVPPDTDFCLVERGLFDPGSDIAGVDL